MCVAQSLRTADKTNHHLPSNCQQAGRAPSAAAKQSWKVDDPPEMYRVDTSPPRLGVSRRTHCAPIDRSPKDEGHSNCGERRRMDTESGLRMRVRWPHAIVAPYRARSVVSSYVTVRVDLMAARRSRSRPSAPPTRVEFCLTVRRALERFLIG